MCVCVQNLRAVGNLFAHRKLVSRNRAQTYVHTIHTNAQQTHAYTHTRNTQTYELERVCGREELLFQKQKKEIRCEISNADFRVVEIPFKPTPDTNGL